ncbi:MAG: hypothetical protein HY048_07120 [Acidobacteria bacterium]|nr:hypothetical protein [Acidobacteriota bacterium]
MLTIGFKVKSGFAVAIVVAGPARAPRAVARHMVAMSDPKEPWTRQPYHSRMFKTETDEGEIARRVKIVKRCAKKSVEDLVADVRRSAEGLALQRAALVVGSVVDPATIGSPHMRAHANEGRLFRTALEDALLSHGIACDVIVEKTLAKRAAADLGRSAAHIDKVMAGFGETLGKPWRAEEKAAATAAWIALGGKPRATSPLRT